MDSSEPVSKHSNTSYPWDHDPPQEVELAERVHAKTSKTTGNLESNSLDLDARALALLGKKQRLNVLED